MLLRVRQHLVKAARIRLSALLPVGENVVQADTPMRARPGRGNKLICHTSGRSPVI